MDMDTMRTEASPTAPTWLSEMTQAISAEIVRQVFPSQQSRRGFHRQISRFVRSDVARVASAGGTQEELTATGANHPAEYGRWLAECGFPPGAVRNTYWIGMRQMLELWAAREWAGAGGVSSDTVARVTNAALDVAESGIKGAALAYEERITELRGQGMVRRRAVVQDILDGVPQEPGGDAEAALAYRLSQSHVCVLVPASEDDRVEETLRAAASATGAQDPLTLALDASWCAWFGYGMAAGRRPRPGSASTRTPCGSGCSPPSTYSAPTTSNGGPSC